MTVLKTSIKRWTVCDTFMACNTDFASLCEHTGKYAPCLRFSVLLLWSYALQCWEVIWVEPFISC